MDGTDHFHERLEALAQQTEALEAHPHTVEWRWRGTAVAVAGLVLMLRVGSSWGQVPPGNDRSLGGNTGGGDGALLNARGVNNTAYGFEALQNNTGNENTAVGSSALGSNTGGSFNTAVGDRALVNNETRPQDQGGSTTVRYWVVRRPWHHSPLPDFPDPFGSGEQTLQRWRLQKQDSDTH